MLIRCDNIEHLVMIGGPGDVVVENDVRKVRMGAQPPTLAPSHRSRLALGMTAAPALPATPTRAPSQDKANAAAGRTTDEPQAAPPRSTVAPARSDDSGAAGSDLAARRAACAKHPSNPASPRNGSRSRQAVTRQWPASRKRRDARRVRRATHRRVEPG